MCYINIVDNNNKFSIWVSNYQTYGLLGLRTIGYSDYRTVTVYIANEGGVRLVWDFELIYYNFIILNKWYKGYIVREFKLIQTKYISSIILYTFNTNNTHTNRGVMAFFPRRTYFLIYYINKYYKLHNLWIVSCSFLLSNGDSFNTFGLLLTKRFWN